MNHGNDFDHILVLKYFASQRGDARFLDNPFRGKITNGDDNFRLHNLYELVQPITAVLHFFFRGISVIFWPAEEGVGDKDVFSRKIDAG